MSHAHPRPRPGSLSVQVKAPKGELKFWERNIDEQKGGKTILFYLYRSPEIGGSDGGLKDVSVAGSPSNFSPDVRGPDEGPPKDVFVCGSRPTFPDVRGQVEDIILGNRERQNQPLDHLTQPETGATLIYATSAINSQRTLRQDFTPFSVSRKGICACLNVPRTSDPVRSLSVQVKAPKGESQSVGKRNI
ncbi:hypothetical protein TNIN_390831 [Trichonephila inaurata madagascariensis]|uniref:Uncharacterized protein n=1 Tax=Trichonephila inaurata madagascariensis TaxID=2747483 RepID=A0A8X6M962_9ARAC|nr:hypothetical protein TNIN_390831 [Trichonephila inaurata madagascariensis]